MLRFLVRRLAVIPLALLLAHFLGYAYAHLVLPLRLASNPFTAFEGEAAPLLPTYIEYVKGAAPAGLGAMQAPRELGLGIITIAEGIAYSLKASLGLMGLALSLSIVVGLTLGFLGAKAEPPRVARWVSSVSTVGLAMPSFYLGSLFFAGWFLYIVWGGPGTEPLLPFLGFGWDSHLVMPTLALMARPTVQIAQVTSSLLAEELGKQYVVAARSIGHLWSTIRRKLAFRNILAPVMVTIASSMRLLVAELIVVEWLFEWPGIGRLLADTLAPSGETFLYAPLLAAIVFLITAFFLTADLITAIAARLVDPRLRNA